MVAKQNQVVSQDASAPPQKVTPFSAMFSVHLGRKMNLGQLQDKPLCRLLFLLYTVYQHVYTTEEERVLREADDQRRRPAEGISKDPSDCQALCQREGIEVPRHCKLATRYL
jgi:hypothetical protein